MNAIHQLFRHVRTVGTRRPGEVKTVSMGRERIFRAYDVGDDTYVFERGILDHLAERPSVLVVNKSALTGRKRLRGRVMTMSTGNHAVAAFPLLDGRFWGLSRLSSARRGEVLMHSMLCANVVDDVIETSQRDVPAKLLFEYDEWLMNGARLSLGDVIMGDRNSVVIEHYRRRGQEWRVKQLAWTEAEMKVALAASRKRIASVLHYYHSARGVHFLSFAEFRRFVALAETDLAGFLCGVRELVAVCDGNRVSFARMQKFRWHHEIELFGLKRGVGIDRIVPELEKLMEAVTLGRLGHLGIIQRAQEIASVYESLLTSPDFADESSRSFIETLYMNITGEVYSTMGEGMTPAFDDRRTALPGATFVDGRPVMHPGADERSEVLLSNLCAMMSKDEVVEYANIYELRNDDDDSPTGSGSTREIAYKTNCRPLECSLIEKRLSHTRRGYGGYMLARIGALRSMGVGLSPYYKLLQRRPGQGRTDYYIRRRCEGEPLDAIPANYFYNADDASVEDREVVLGMATLMGDAAAQNLAMKKFDPASESPLYGVGKELYEFEYDIIRQRVVPKKVSTCSIRGSFGWPCLDHTEENLRALGACYLTNYAHTLKEFQKRHSVPMLELAERFMNGFEFRTHAMEWQLSVMRDQFEEFLPDIPSRYRFRSRWNFVMWALERQERRLQIIRKTFFEKVRVVEDEDIRNNPQ